jgi:environmental stress-induced protein Ves
LRRRASSYKALAAILAKMRLIHYPQLLATPWKNGGGVTREIFSDPPGATLDSFLWRISIADVSCSGPFSVFPGIDRVIVLLDGDGMHLEFADGRNHDLTSSLTPYRFRGEEPVHAHLAGAPSRDLNLMLRRDAVEGDVEVWRDARDTIAGLSVVLFCVKGQWIVAAPNGTRCTLDLQQTLINESGDDCLTVVPQEPDSVLLAISVGPKSIGNHHAT